MLRAVLLAAALVSARAIIPNDLSNFQGKWPCATSVRMGRPKARLGCCTALSLLHACPPR